MTFDEWWSEYNWEDELSTEDREIARHAWRAAIDAAMKGHCPKLEKKQGFGEGSDAFWDFVDKKRKK